MSEAYIVAALRTATGRRRGMYSDILPLTLSTIAVKEIVAQTGVAPELVDDVILGCVTPMAEQGANIARLTALNAHFPVTVPGVTINRMCGSSQQAVHFAAQAIMAGDMDFVVAGGVEHMTRVPMASDYPSSWPEDFPYELVNQGISAELIAEKWGLTRVMLDEFSFASHQKAAAATLDGLFADEIVPVPLPDAGAGPRDARVDEGIRFEPNLAKMATLRPAFKEDGVITAGNSSQISDGAAALVIASERAIKRHNLTPMARIVARVVVGDDPIFMLTGVIPATRQVLQRAGLSLDAIDIFEVNEAFASVVLAWLAEIRPDPAKVNPRGGAVALGHPLGASGARIMTTLVHALHQTGGRYGLQVMCIGHGMATATIIERV